MVDRFDLNELYVVLWLLSAYRMFLYQLSFSIEPSFFRVTLSAFLSP